MEAFDQDVHNVFLFIVGLDAVRGHKLHHLQHGVEQLVLVFLRRRHVEESADQFLDHVNFVLGLGDRAAVELRRVVLQAHWIRVDSPRLAIEDQVHNQFQELAFQIQADKWSFEERGLHAHEGLDAFKDFNRAVVTIETQTRH